MTEPPPLTTLQLTHQGDGAGSTQSIYSLSRELARCGHRVLVGCPPGTLLARMIRDTASLEHVPLDFRGTRHVAPQIARVIAERRVDVLNSHATGDRRAVTWLRWRGQLPQPFVVTRRTMPLTLPPELIAVGLTADRTIAVSATVASALRRRLHPAGRLRVVPNGIDVERITAEPAPQDLAMAREALGGGEGDSGRPVVVVIARRKDQHILLRALPALVRPVTVAFVGIRPDTELAAAQATVPDRHRIVFVPFTEPPRALAFYRFATVAALPSRIEGLSQALLEAMSLGVPVIASAAGGNAELVYPGETGLLVPPLDAAAWTRALDRILGDDGLRARVAAAGRALVRAEFTMPRTAERTEVVYREAIARRRLLAGERTG
ncbi:MAG TPA: glycosyltransferase family 4 protein [Gemmatimonadales bacterium]|nr:glycosyltransferase family 4 protein [Gemmatimonadales bacterium]